MAQLQTSTEVGRTPRLSPRKALNLWGERLGMLLIVLGIGGLIQPWQQTFFSYGFSVLLIGTIIFIVASHL